MVKTIRMLKYIVFSLSLIIFNGLNAQSEREYSKSTLGIQVLGQSLVSFHYEHTLAHVANFTVNSDLGLGIAEFSDDESNSPEPATYVIHTGLMAQIGGDVMSFYASFQPSSYFYGDFSFVNINSNLGARLNVFGDDGFIMLGYTPRLYSSLTTAKQFFTPSKFCIRLAGRF